MGAGATLHYSYTNQSNNGGRRKRLDSQFSTYLVMFYIHIYIFWGCRGRYMLLKMNLFIFFDLVESVSEADEAVYSGLTGWLRF